MCYRIKITGKQVTNISGIIHSSKSVATFFTKINFDKKKEKKKKKKKRESFYNTDI